MNIKIVTLSLLALMLLAVFIVPVVTGQGQTQISVQIYQMTPESGTGPVGQFVTILGSIFTANSTYEIYFDNNLIRSAKSDGFYVEANFTIPESPSGSHKIILRDPKININATKQFEVTTAYSINAIVPSAPSQLQEGNSVNLNITVTGGEPNTAYYANITVTLPSPATTGYSKVVPLGSASQVGTARAQVTYPDSSFQPNGSRTDYAGVYTLYFNQTESLGSSQFTVGFTDLTSYHRGETVKVRATSYQPSETATLTITSVRTGSTLNTETLTASAEGIVSSMWVVSSDASVGDYTVKIMGQNTQKTVPDSQTITVPGYSVQVKTLNLAGEPVSGISVQALDVSTSSIYNGTSGSSGIALLKLEKGSHGLTAFWNGVNVGTTNITVTGEGTFDLRAALTDFTIKVQDEKAVLMSFISLEIRYQYLTSDGKSQTGSASGQTDTSGGFTLKSVLPGITYTVNASIYNRVFNLNNNTVTDLPAQPFTQTTIIVPSRNLSLNIVGYNLSAIPNARIELVEVTNGIFYSATTDSSGTIAPSVTFGLYRVRVYKDNILVNETLIEAFENSQRQIRCTLYGIQLSVSVVDFFGQPFADANVTINGPGSERWTKMTQGDGTATFDNVIGGDLQIVAFASGAENDYQAVTVTVDQPTTVNIKIDKYVHLGPVLLPASVLLTAITIIVAILMFVSIEVYRRKYLASRKS